MKNLTFPHLIAASTCVLLLSTNAGCAQNPPEAKPATSAAPASAPLPIPLADEAAFFDALDLERPELTAVKTAVQARDWDAAKTAWARHLETRTAPHWLWSRRDKVKIIALLKEKDNGLARFVAPADLVLARTFNPQGKVRQLDKDINWIIAGEETHVLSRFAYWRDMGLAYWQTGDDKYAQDFVSILKDWLADNPTPTDLSGVTKSNTTWRTLEAGIRVREWFNTMELFMDAPAFDAQAKYLMSKSLLEHARYLYEWTPKFRGGNWQVTEASGVATVGLMMPEAKDAAKWRERGLTRLTEHMQADVLPDGGHSELTPSYHQWVMNQYAEVAQLAKINDSDVAGLTARHEKMYEWLMALSQPDSIVPPIADTHDPLDIRDDMATGALLYNRPDMKFLGAKNGPASWVWLFGADAFDRYAKIASQKPTFTSILLPDSKYLTMRSGWDKSDKYLLFDSAPGSVGHSHADKLQVLAYAGRSLLVDPGIYSYGEPLSTSYFRNPEAHNVVLIDGKGSPRSADRKTDAQLTAWQTTPQADFAAGTTDFDGFHHQRSVLFVKPNYWVVVDQISGAAGDSTPHEIQRLFHFPIGPAKAENNIARTAFTEGTNLQIQVADSAKLELGSGWIPTEGAKAQSAPVAFYKVKGALPMTLVTVLTPFNQAGALPKIEKLPSDGSNAQIRVSFADGQSDDIAIAGASSALKIGSQQKTGRALVVRKGPQANAVLALDGSIAGSAPAAKAPTKAATGSATVTASSSQDTYPESNAVDKNAATFWVSGGSDPGDGPTPRHPEWLQFSFAAPVEVGALKISGREGFSPRECALQFASDGKDFRTIREFTLKDGEETQIKITPTTSQTFRVVIISAYDRAHPKEPRNVQISEIALLAPDGRAL